MRNRSREIEAKVRTDTEMIANKVECICQYHFVGTQHVNGARRQVNKSETAKFSTKYVPEFLKHFSGSFINAIISNTCEITPKIQIACAGMLIFPN